MYIILSNRNVKGALKFRLLFPAFFTTVSFTGLSNTHTPHPEQSRASLRYPVYTGLKFVHIIPRSRSCLMERNQLCVDTDISSFESFFQ